MPRGGGTGWAGGAVPRGSGVVLALERLDRVRALDPLQWRMHVEAGRDDGDRAAPRARERPLLPARPGRRRESQIGGNVATNAGGPHCFKYGVTGAWVTGHRGRARARRARPLRRARAQGRRRLRPALAADRLGGDARRHHRGLAAADPGAAPARCPSPRSTPAPTAVRRRCERLMAAGPVPAAIEYLDGGDARRRRRRISRRRTGWRRLPRHQRVRQRRGRPRRAGRGARARARSAGVLTPERSRRAVALARRRRPRRQLARARASSRRTSPCRSSGWPRRSRRRCGSASGTGCEACSWGHAGDGNLHATFLLDARDQLALQRARTRPPAR